jgi:hypothetical protein
MTRRIVIEVEYVKTAPRFGTNFPARYVGTACFKQGDEESFRCTSGGCASVENAIQEATESLAAICGPQPMCDMPLSCKLSGRCEQQFGPRGTACNE